MAKLLQLSLLGLALLASPAVYSQGKPVAVPNLDFEKGLDGWKNSKSGASMVSVLESGKKGKGVRVDDGDTTLNARLTSDKGPAEGGKTYEVTFDARSHGPEKGCGGFLVFYSKDGTRLEPDHTSGHHKDVTPEAKDWSEFKLNAKAPADAAFVGVEIRSNKKSLVKVDFDNFRVYELP
jgi:hypothetical protein